PRGTGRHVRCRARSLPGAPELGGSTGSFQKVFRAHAAVGLRRQPRETMANVSSAIGSPLEGIRVLDLSRVFAGPLCTMVLGDLGAEIIKVEHPTRGDDTRDWGQHVTRDRTTYFNCANRNKRSVTLDLQSAKGQELARGLAAQCDVVVQNFKFGGAEKLNLGYEHLREITPDIIYCSISGYDRSGPEAARPGYDLVLQAETGLMHMNGEPTQPPLKFGTSVVDMF